MNTISITDIPGLSIQDHIRLVELIWNSVAFKRLNQMLSELKGGLLYMNMKYCLKQRKE